MKQALNIIGWLGTALVVAAVVLIVVGSEWSRYAIPLALTGLVCVLLYPIVYWREVAAQFRRRQSRYAAIAGTSVVVMLAILIAVNYLSNKRNKRWDLTANSVNSLSEQSLRVLGDLTSPLKLVVIDRGAQLEGHRPRMSMYDNASTQVSVEFLDAEGDPIRAKQYGITAVPTIVVEYMGREEKVTTVEERDITSAVIRAVTGTKRKMYFVQGHGEKDPKSSDRTGYAGIVQLLQGDNIEVEPLVLTQHKEIPADATVVAMVGPTTEPLDEELDQIRQYLEKGGKLLLMLDPAIGERAQSLPKLRALALNWGIEVGNDIVLDVSGRSNNPTFAVASPPYPSHPVTSDFGQSTVFPIARSVTPVSSAPQGKTVQKMVETSPNAWAEVDLAGLQAGKQEPEMNAENGDRPGPVGIAATATAAVEKPAEEKKADSKEPAADPPQTRIAVFGDSDFASNAVGNSVGNADLFLNTVSWLTAQENLIAIRPRESSDSRLNITPQGINLIRWFSLLLLPGAVIATGIYTWSRRRRS
jgi:ABC-type uncharacterized transport system involved in gliding motility auxiliary subunit